MKIWPGVVLVLCLLLVGMATLRGFDPGDAAGAVRMTSARELGLIGAVVAAVALAAQLLRLRWPRRALTVLGVVLAVVATVALVLATGFWLGVVPAR